MGARVGEAVESKVHFRVAATLAVLAAGFTLSASPAGEVDGAAIDRLVARALDAFNTPGMAVAVVRGDQIFYVKGHGVRRIDGSDPVTGDTLFQIGSLTKAITVGALAILMDEGKLTWDDKVIDHIPEFRLHDAYVTREFTIRDLLSHRSGLPLGAGDLLFWPDGRSSMADLYRALAHIKPVSGFRSTFAYDNLFYIVAGDIVERRSGLSWAEFVERRIFKPLGMDDCKSNHGRVPGGANEATPHVKENGDVVTAPFADWDSGGPDTSESPALISSAGGVNCSVRGLAKWVSLQFRKGRMENGEWLFSRERHDEMWTPVTISYTAPAPKNGRMKVFMYALGWSLRPMFGHQQAVTHTGGMVGMTTTVMLFPEHELGIVVLSNSSNGDAMGSVSYQIAASYLGEEIPDPVEGMASRHDSKQDEALAEMQTAWDNRVKDSRPSLPLDAYAQVYRDAWYGPITVSRAGKGLRISMDRTPSLKGTLRHFQYDTFVAEWDDRSLIADAYVTFHLNAEGRIERLSMKNFDPRTDFSFDFHHLDPRPEQ